MSQELDQSQPLFLKEKHKRREVAIVSFSETVVQYHPTFEARKALVEKIGNYRNEMILASVIPSNGIMCAYNTRWVDEDHRFEFLIWFYCFEEDIEQWSSISAA